MSTGPAVMEPLRVLLLSGCLHLLSGRVFSPPDGGSLLVAVGWGGEAVLPCGAAPPLLSGVWTLEWQRLDSAPPGGSAPSGDSAPPLTLLAVRGGRPLPRETAPGYHGRTAPAADGGLRLINATLGDSGKYRCVVDGAPVAPGVRLVVGRLWEVELGVVLTASGRLLVQCQAAARGLDASLRLLDAAGRVLDQTNGTPRGGDSLRLSAAGETRGQNGPIVCRAEMPQVDLVMESRLNVTDDFLPEAAAGPGCIPAVVPAVVLAVVLLVVLVPLWVVQELRFFLIGFCVRKLRGWRNGDETEHLIQDEVDLTEFGDIGQMSTSGASEVTARANGLTSGGEEASALLAQADLAPLRTYRDTIRQVAKKHRFPPGLIAGIISKQSRAGEALQLDGYGRFHSSSYGLMQINKDFHAVSGSPFSQEHIDDGTKYLIHLVKTIGKEFPTWTSEQKLKGGLVAYISGPDRLRDAAREGIDADSLTPTQDFANDVIARAKWFHSRLF